MGARGCQGGRRQEIGCRGIHRRNRRRLGRRDQRRTSMTNSPLSLRSMLALTAIVAAIGAIAIQATAGSAAPTPKSLHLVATSLKKVGFFPKAKPRQGDRFGFGDRLSGDDTGFDRVVCTLIGGKSLC